MPDAELPASVNASFGLAKAVDRSFDVPDQRIDSFKMAMSETAPRRLYFDESGFTGYNLLDPSQPCFVVASIDLAPATAEEMLRHAFPKYQGTEYKSSNLWKAKDKSGFLKLAESVKGVCDHILVFTSNKRFVIFTKMIDFLVEPIISRAGYDFYADDFARRYVNYTHFGFEQFAPDLYEKVLKEYQDFSRNPGRGTLRRIYVNLKKSFNEAPEEVRIFGEQILLGLELFEEFHDFDWFRSSNDIHLSTIIAMVGWWRARHREDFEVVHDASAHFFRQSELWENVTDPRIGERLHPTATGPDIEFPLRVTNTIAQDSRTCHSIQLCDVIAGFAARYARRPDGGGSRALLDQILDAGFGEVTSNGIRPTTDFPQVIPPRPVNGPDAVDRMTSIIVEARSKGPRR